MENSHQLAEICAMSESSSNQIGKFVLEFMQKQKLSMRELADMMGITHPTLSRLINHDDPPRPQLDFFVKLSKVTGTDLCALLAIAFPEEVKDIDPESRIMAETIRQLPDEAQRIIRGFIANEISRSPNQTL